MKKSFWEWLRDYATKKIREDYVNKYHHDRKCPQCDTWISETDGCDSVESDSETTSVEFMICKKCGHKSKWLMDAPAVICVG